MIVAVLSALAVAMVGVSALVVNRGVKRNRRKSSTRTRSEPAPFLIFKLDDLSSAELADVPTCRRRRGQRRRSHVLTPRDLMQRFPWPPNEPHCSSPSPVLPT